MDKKTYDLLHNYPLEMKVEITKRRIIEFVDMYGYENVYVSFSGGKDSTVLLDIVRSIYPNVTAVFSDTGLEYPELKDFVKSFDNVSIVRPKISFKEVIEKYGYPVISKEQSYYIYQIRNTKSDKLRNLRLNGSHKGYFKLSDKWKFMLDAPFKIHNKCCDVMKKNPLKSYGKKTGKKPIIGTLACESSLRRQEYMRTGCNSFDDKASSKPLGFWKEEDVLQYIYENKLPIASVYGDVIFENGSYKTTGVNRTGCIFCLYGVQYDGDINRIMMLKKTHPKIHSYCLNNLGLKSVMEYMGVKYE